MLALTLNSFAQSDFEMQRTNAGPPVSADGYILDEYEYEVIPSHKHPDNIDEGGRLGWSAECNAHAQARVTYVSEWCGQMEAVANHCWILIEAGGELFVVEQEGGRGGWAVVECIKIDTQDAAMLRKEKDTLPTVSIGNRAYRHEHYVETAHIAALGLAKSGQRGKINDYGGEPFEWFHPTKPRTDHDYTLGEVKGVSIAFLQHFPKYTVLEHNCQGVHHSPARPPTRPDARHARLARRIREQGVDGDHDGGPHGKLQQTQGCGKGPHPRGRFCRCRR